MGIDVGFDLFPPIAPDDAGRIAVWQNFLGAVMDKYQGDPNVVVNKQGDVEINLGEHPTLLKEAHKFRRFSSKVTGRHAGNVEEYIREIYRLARQYYPNSVYWWSEYVYEGEPEGKYNWTEVYDAAK